MHVTIGNGTTRGCNEWCNQNHTQQNGKYIPELNQIHKYIYGYFEFEYIEESMMRIKF